LEYEEFLVWALSRLDPCGLLRYRACFRFKLYQQWTLIGRDFRYAEELVEGMHG